MDWMKKTLAIVSVSVLLFTGCAGNQNNESSHSADVHPTPAPTQTQQQNVIMLTAEKKQEIENAWFTATDTSLGTWSSETVVQPSDGIRYYGNYGGYDILFKPADADAQTSIEVGQVTFTHNASFALYAYRDGSFCTLGDVYADGVISETDLTQLAQLHLRYERLFPSLQPGVFDDVLEAMKVAFLKQFVREDGWTTADLSVAYYGEYDGAHVGFVNGILFYTQALTSETIGEFTFHYRTGQKLLVYFDGELMSLRDAYDRGILSDDALSRLHQAYDDSGNVTE